MRRCCLLVIAMSIGMGGWAETPSALPDVPQSPAEAQAQRARAASLRDDAERQYKSDQDGCYSKVLVNDCLATAKKRYTEKIVAARQLDQPARDFEREARRQEAAAKEAQRALDQPLREQRQQEQTATYRAEQATKAAEREQKLADKARQAEQGRQRRAAEEAKREQKREQRMRRDAEREAKKAKSDRSADAAGVQ